MILMETDWRPSQMKGLYWIVSRYRTTISSHTSKTFWFTSGFMSQELTTTIQYLTSGRFKSLGNVLVVAICEGPAIAIDVGRSESIPTRSLTKPLEDPSSGVRLAQYKDPMAIPRYCVCLSWEKGSVLMRTCMATRSSRRCSTPALPHFQLVPRICIWYILGCPSYELQYTTPPDIPRTLKDNSNVWGWPLSQLVI